MTTTRGAASTPQGSGRSLVDTCSVLASWFSAYGLYGLVASPAELLTLPRILPYGLAGLGVASFSAALCSALGMYRPRSPLMGLRVVAVVMGVRAVELAVLMGAVTVLGESVCAKALLLTYSLLVSTAVLAWRAAVQLIAPNGFDFSRLRRGQRPSAAELQVTVRDSGVRTRAGEEARALPRSKSR